MTVISDQDLWLFSPCLFYLTHLTLNALSQMVEDNSDFNAQEQSDTAIIIHPAFYPCQLKAQYNQRTLRSFQLQRVRHHQLGFFWKSLFQLWTCSKTKWKVKGEMNQSSNMVLLKPFMVISHAVHIKHFNLVIWVLKDEHHTRDENFGSIHNLLWRKPLLLVSRLIQAVSLKTIHPLLIWYPYGYPNLKMWGIKMIICTTRFTRSSVQPSSHMYNQVHYTYSHPKQLIWPLRPH